VLGFGNNKNNVFLFYLFVFFAFFLIHELTVVTRLSPPLSVIGILCRFPLSAHVGSALLAEALRRLFALFQSYSSRRLCSSSGFLLSPDHASVGARPVAAFTP
jgi:hypothetical protein